MDYKEKVDRLVGILLEAEENYESVELILDADLAYDVATLLEDELCKEFLYECEEDDFDYLLKNNDILGVSVAVYGDEIIYFLQEVLYDKGTLEEEMSKYYIQDYLIDCLDLDKLHGDKFILKELDNSKEECDSDCANCPYNDDEDYEKEIEEEDTTDVLFEELLSSIDELDLDEYLVENVYDLIKDTISDAIEMGYNEGFDDCLKEVKESIDCI